MATQITNELEGVVAKVNTFTEPGRADFYILLLSKRIR